jgi:hypothetical protein
MIVTLHQPEHLVWNGLLDKIKKADLFVVYDDVQFEKNYFQNRNRIRAGDGWMWLTVPIKKHPLKTKINEIEISYNEPWQKAYLEQLRISYLGSRNFNTLYPKIQEIINQNFKMLVDLNLALLYLFMKEFNIKTKVMLSSSLKIPPEFKSSNRVLEVCKRVRATTYLSGQSGVDYLDVHSFVEAGIKVKFHSFDITDNLSAVDYLFNYA